MSTGQDEVRFVEPTCDRLIAALKLPLRANDCDDDDEPSSLMEVLNIAGNTRGELPTFNGNGSEPGKGQRRSDFRRGSHSPHAVT